MTIPFSDFQKIELKIGTILSAECVPNSEKLIKLAVGLGSITRIDAGSEESRIDADTRQVVAGIGKAYTPEALVGRQIVIVANLEPRTLMGLESQGMLLAAIGPDGNPILLTPDKEVPSGSTIR